MIVRLKLMYNIIINIKIRFWRIIIILYRIWIKLFWIFVSALFLLVSFHQNAPYVTSSKTMPYFQNDTIMYCVSSKWIELFLINILPTVVCIVWLHSMTWISFIPTLHQSWCVWLFWCSFLLLFSSYNLQVMYKWTHW